ncbi:eCIS core domain-containing protein [Micromonospora sp. L32]|uniref:eCIS core domain-containing protein n=1 Tax=unclassified Micromonospora TaxID=2617518 RepID=UPI003F8BA8E5
MRDHEQRPDPGSARSSALRRAPAAGAPVTAPDGRSPALDQRCIQALQRSVGNAAVVQMLHQRHTHTASCGHGPEGQDTAAATVQRSAVHDVLRSAGRPLAEPLRTEMEARLGADFSSVRVHDDAAARRSSDEIGARAYTSGEHVVIGDGGGDKHTLAHELTHVVQQRHGPVAGTDAGNGVSISDPSDHYERAAEANARHVMRAPLDAQRPVQARSAAAAPDGPVTVQTMPPPVPVKPAHLRAGQTSEAAAAEEAPPPQPAVPKHGYLLKGDAGPLRFFRADRRAPEDLSQGMRSFRSASVTTELAAFLSDPRAYAQDHVSNNNPRLVSTALDQECGGYASNDRHLYQIEVSGWYRFEQEPPARSRILAKPAIYANSTSLGTATAAVIGPIGATQEMDFFAEIPRSFITACRRPGASDFTPL